MTVAWAKLLHYRIRSPFGNDARVLAEALLTKRSVAAAQTHPFSTFYPNVKMAGLPRSPSCVHEKVLSPIAAHAYQIGCEVMTQVARPTSDRLGVFVGMGGLRAQWSDLVPVLAQQSTRLESAWQRGLKNIHPFWMLKHLSNNVHALLAKDIDARGEGFTFGGGNAGAQALEAACAALHSGAIDMALVVAYDSMLEPEVLVQWKESHVAAEAAVAMVLTASDEKSVAISARSGVNFGETPNVIASRLSENRSFVLDAPEDADFNGNNVLGAVGSATALAQGAIWAECLKMADSNVMNKVANVGKLAICLSFSAPDLLGIVQVCGPR